MPASTPNVPYTNPGQPPASVQPAMMTASQSSIVTTRLRTASIGMVAV